MSGPCSSLPSLQRALSSCPVVCACVLTSVQLFLCARVHAEAKGRHLCPAPHKDVSAVLLRAHSTMASEARYLASSSQPPASATVCSGVKDLHTTTLSDPSLQLLFLSLLNVLSIVCQFPSWPRPLAEADLELLILLMVGPKGKHALSQLHDRSITNSRPAWALRGFRG